MLNSLLLNRSYLCIVNLSLWACYSASLSKMPSQTLLQVPFYRTPSQLTLKMNYLLFPHYHEYKHLTPCNPGSWLMANPFLLWENLKGKSLIFPVLFLLSVSFRIYHVALHKLLFNKYQREHKENNTWKETYTNPCLVSTSSLKFSFPIDNWESKPNLQCKCLQCHPFKFPLWNTVCLGRCNSKGIRRNLKLVFLAWL